eukprot:236426_1
MKGDAKYKRYTPQIMQLLNEQGQTAKGWGDTTTKKVYHHLKDKLAQNEKDQYRQKTDELEMQAGQHRIGHIRDGGDEEDKNEGRYEGGPKGYGAKTAQDKEREYEDD